MVRRWRDQRHTRLAVAQPSDVGIHLGTRQLTAFTWLGALSHFDLELLAAAQVLRGHTEATGSDLLDRRAGGIAIAQAANAGEHLGAPLAIDIVEHVEAGGIFAALTAVALAADAVHGNRQHLMGLAGERPKAHAPGAEAGADALNALDLINRQRRWGRLELEQVAQGGDGPVFQQRLVGGEVVVTGSSLHRSVESLGHLRAVEVILTARAVLHKTHELKLGAVEFGKRLGMQAEGFTGQISN